MARSVLAVLALTAGVLAVAPSSEAGPVVRGIQKFPVPTPGSAPEGITTGPDGNVWFTEIDGNNIARVVRDRVR